jgi:hypothetical protein
VSRLLGSAGARSGAASLALGAALAAVAFGAKGGSEVTRAATVEVGLLVAGGLVAAAAIAWGRPGRLDGGLAVALFALLAVLTALSVGWSVAPELTWLEANRTLAYLAVFAAAVGAARLAPGGWSVALKGLLLAAAAVIGYALASRVWPGALADTELYARIGKPYDYWNAVGVTAALAIPPALWLGARRSGHQPLNALAYPLLGLLFVALMLSYSRGALAAAIAGVALWLAFVPLRLRSLAVLAIAAAGAAPVVLWALSKDAFTQDGVPIAVREAVAGTFGLLLLAMTAALLAAGLATGFRATRRAPSPRLRRRVGLAAAAAACVVPLLAFGSVATSDRGIGGTVSDLTSEDAATTGGPERLTTASSSRGRYWRQAADVFEEQPLRGTGAGTFGVARLRHRDDPLVARHAHGFVAQTASDLGALGLGVTTLLVLAWLAATGRAVGVRRGAPWDAERVGVAALGLAALVFGLQSAIDWTWFVPGPAVMALVAAGFVAGRGRLPALAAGGVAPALAGQAYAGGVGADAPTRELPAGTLLRAAAARVRGARRPPAERLVPAVCVLLLALVAAWSAWQPERSDAASERALSLLEGGQLDRAASEAQAARDANPLSPKPLFVQAAVADRGGDRAAATDLLQRAVVENPSVPETWLRLATYQLRELDRPLDALRTLQGALYLDPHSRAAQSTFFEARQRARPGTEVTTAP